MPFPTAGVTPDGPVYPQEELIILPLEDVLRATADAIARLQSFLVADVVEIMQAAFRAQGNFTASRAVARQAYCDFGRPSRGFDPRGVIDKIMDQFGMIQRNVTHLMARIHGIHYQFVEWVGVSGRDGLIFRLRPMAIKVEYLQELPESISDTYS
jgi:hypothetical protein